MEKLIEMARTTSLSTAELRHSGGQVAFQWGGTISAMMDFDSFYIIAFCYIVLLINDRLDILFWIVHVVDKQSAVNGRRSALYATLLVLYLFTSFPTVLFKILRGQFGYWIAFLAVAANLFFAETFPVSRFVLFVITPDWLTNGLRDTFAGGVLCLVMAVYLVMAELREIGRLRNCECNCYCFWFFFGVAFLLFFTILYLCIGPWWKRV